MLKVVNLQLNGNFTKKVVIEMKVLHMELCCLLLSLSVVQGYCEMCEIRLEKKRKGDLVVEVLVVKNGLETGESKEIVDLYKLGVHKVMDYIYDNRRDVLFINEYATYYNIKVVDLKKKKLIRTIWLNTIEPDLRMLVNPSTGMLFVAFWDQDSDCWTTSIFDKNYELLRKIPRFSVQEREVYSSKNGEHQFLIGYDSEIKKDIFLTINTRTGEIIKKKYPTDLAIKGEYARIRDGKQGNLLLEYRFRKNGKEFETYILYEPENDKIIAQIDEVPYHVGDVYLDDSSDNIIINQAKMVKLDTRTERKYTNKISIYSFRKGKKAKEISIEEGSEIKAVKDKIYLRQNHKLRIESIE